MKQTPTPPNSHPHAHAQPNPTLYSREGVVNRTEEALTEGVLLHARHGGRLVAPPLSMYVCVEDKCVGVRQEQEGKGEGKQQQQSQQHYTTSHIHTIATIHMHTTHPSAIPRMRRSACLYCAYTSFKNRSYGHESFAYLPSSPIPSNPITHSATHRLTSRARRPGNPA